MKIGLFVPSWPPGAAANGIVTYASNLVPALRQLGHEVFILSPNLPAGFTDPYAVDLTRFMYEPSLWGRVLRKWDFGRAHFNALSFSISSAVRHLVNRYQIDVFEMEESFGWSVSVSRLKLLPVVVRLHGPWLLTGRFNVPSERNAINLGRKQREREGIESAVLVTANCNETLAAVKSCYRLDLNKSRVLPNPIDAVDEAEIWDAQSCDKNSLLFVGRFDSLKGADLVLKAFYSLSQSNPKLRLTFVGPDIGIKAANGEILFFEDYIAAHFPNWFREKIQFRGTMDHAELMSIRRTHFLTIAASQYETMGYLVLEPMSLGCPFVTTAVGGIPEFIKDGHNGILVPSQDVHAMVAGCKALLDNRELAARIGRQAWIDCRDLYGSKTVAKQSIAAYQEAIHLFKGQQAIRPTV
jgi:glycosyltransferase involved in cell wall biosynthesis